MKLSYLNDILKLDNLGKEFAQINEDAGKKDILCISTNRGERIHISAGLERFVLYVAKDSYSAISAYQKLKGYVGESVCLFQPNDDLLFYRKSFQRSYAGDRVKSLYKVLTKECKILVTSPTGLVQYLPKKSRVKASIATITTGQELDMYTLIDALINAGYEREEACEEKNTFSVHGDIVNVFLSSMEMPVRISFFGDLIENIKTYEVESLLSTGSLDSITIYPNNDLLYKPNELETGLKAANVEAKKLTVDAYTRCEQILNELSLNSTCTQEMQWLLPFLSKSNDTIFDYLPTGGLIVFDEPESIYSVIRNYYKETASRVAQLVLDGEITKAHDRIIIKENELLQKLSDVKKLSFSNLSATNPLIKPEEIIKVPSRRLNNYVMHYDVLFKDLNTMAKTGFMVLVCQPTKDRARSLQQAWYVEDIPCSYRDSFEGFREGIYIVPEDIEDGFLYPDSRIAVIGSEDILKKKDETATRNKNAVFVIPKVGDYVVHEFHGIGRCLGTNRIKTGTTEQDYIIIEYKNGGLLYLPTNQMNRISRYSGSDTTPRLSSLGGSDFAKVKEGVKKSLKAMAINLVDLYSKRMNKQGHKYSEDDELMREFEDDFEFVPTPDQVDAIRDIKQDMERGIIMDRLLCGDVGYGKTEVALRAIFKTILDSKQAAILAPTTILAQQHYNTAKERFKQFGIGIELVTRLKTDAEIKQSLTRIKEGKSQLIIATHRLLSKDVEFKDLGLLVLDEEQRFGVEHKEKLKVLKNNLNVLTLSATPIPRTLNMALIGVRDISVLETPPVNRLPVQTSVTELTQALLQDTILREIARGGQVFILYNEVKTISRFASQIQELVPESKVVFAHGQMSSEELENRMTDFYSKAANVLVCTTIIENGIDIPDANTLIVCNADRLGLSQLYQLRGRVGRSNRLAYAYFTVDPNKILTSDAMKRLNAIMDYTELGSGFKIAMRDLEIRGAGNILGKEQHGHIEKVGYDMYCKLLQQCVNELQGVQKPDFNCQVDADVDAYLDKNYVGDDNSRLKIFRDIIDIRTPDDEIQLIKRLTDSFGEPPKSLLNLVTIGFMKNIAEELGIESIRIKVQGMGIIFGKVDFFQNEKLMIAISDLKDDVLLTNDDKPRLIFNCKKINNIAKLELLKKFLLSAAGYC